MDKKQRITCLLIDDDIEDQEIFAHAIRHLGLDIEVVTANDGIHAIEKIKKDDSLNPYFIFVDLNMPRMNGIECLVEIKKISKVKNVPVYLYSTYTDPATLKKGRELGATDLVVKASSMQELEDTLSRILPAAKTDKAAYGI